MRHSTVSAPIESCNASNLNSPTLRFCALKLLHGQVLYFIVEPKSKTKELYNQACAHLESQGMLDTDLFGLAVILDGEYLFVDPDYKLSKYATKNWRSSSTHGLDSSGKPLLAFHFRVQFYVDSPLLLRDEASRHQYYLQLRNNVKTRNLVYAYIAEELIYLLVGLALQADLGDYVEAEHTENYFALQEYFPEQMVAHGNETRLFKNSTIVHKANRTLSKAQAEIQFIREASSRDSFPLPHNSHLYRLKQKKHDPNPGSLWFLICTRGIELYEEKSSKSINGTFFWNNIGKLCFDRKKFEIRSLNPSGERMIYYTSSDEKSKHLLTLCRLTHQFCMAIQTRLNELTRKEEEEKKQYRDWGTELNVKLTEMCYNHSADQRISVISNTSSNTTSGIVSDRVQSLDESEDDLDMEIMINSPPAASLESLALAHLRDSFSKENRKVGRKISQNSLATHQTLAETKGETSDQLCVNKLALPTTPAPTDGSQCSSSCSTVVITGYSQEEAKTQLSQTTVTDSNRSQSTTSSLELGYSHTAQNSALSDSASCCLELDYSVQSAHTSSGIYTLQSSCETNTVAMTVIAGSSETSGIGQSLVEDLDGMRSRSGSIISTPGSFHGDGSDPSDTGHGTPLTAAELSDLIVGRSPKPCRGKYPSVATVSETLDSVADYVTLPPPPAFPPAPMSFKLTEPLVSHCGNPPRSTISSKSSESSSYVARHGSISNESQNSGGVSGGDSKYFSEEAVLQRQIQFQHLAASSSSHLLIDTLPNSHSALAKPQICCSTNDIPQLNESTFAAAVHQLTRYRQQQQQHQQHLQQIQQQIQQQQQQQHHKSCTSLPLRSEEANARVITTRPYINVLRAQSTYVPSSSLVPSYSSAVTINSSNPVTPNQAITIHPYHHQHHLHHHHHHHHHHQSLQPPPLPPIPQSTHVSSNLLSKFGELSLCSVATHSDANSVPVVGANNYLDVRKSGAAFLQQFHEKFPPPPPFLYQRQPPPPPPPPPVRNHYSGCGNAPIHHLHHHQQFDQYRQQLYSDVDYVMYPLKDPAISKQEYLDSKEASGHCATKATPAQYLSQSSLNAKMAAVTSISRPCNNMLATGPSLYSLYGRKTRAMYQSTPNVAMVGGGGNYLAAAGSSSTSSTPPFFQQYPNAPRYASNQNLTSELSGCSNSSLMYLSSKYPSSSSPLFSTTASLYSSMQSLRQDTASASSIYGRILPISSSNCNFSRTRSDDNILNCVDHQLQHQQQQRSSHMLPCSEAKFRKPPPPPPPPYDSQKSLVCLPEFIESACRNISSNGASIFELCNRSRDHLDSIGDIYESSDDQNISLDISSLREKSKNLDLPLISALCNDKTLLKQTNTVDVCCAASSDLFETSGNSWYNSPDDSLPDSSSGPMSAAVATASSAATTAATYDVHPATSINGGLHSLMATKTLANSCVIVDQNTSTQRHPHGQVNDDGHLPSFCSTAVASSVVANVSAATTTIAVATISSSVNCSPSSAMHACLPKAMTALETSKTANHSTRETPLLAKIKPINAKLSKTSVSASSKLKYTISQPIQKTVAKVKSVNSGGGGGAAITDAKMSFVNKVRCKSSKIKSVDVGTATPRSRPSNAGNA